MRTNRVRKAIAFAVMLMMLLGTAVPVMAASGDNQIVINAPKDEPGNADRFVAYQIFKGTLTTDEHQMNDIDWGDGVNRTTLVTAMKASNLTVPARTDTPYASTETTFGGQFTAAWTEWKSKSEHEMNEAAFVAQWLGTVSEGISGRADANPYADAFARIVAVNLNDEGTASNKTRNDDKGVQWTINVPAAGYYLVKDTYSGTAASVSSYILDVLGTAEVNIKASIPQVDKRMEDDHEELSDGAIYRPFEAINYMIDGTVAKNIDEYSKYEYKFIDTLSKGLDLVKYETSKTSPATEITPTEDGTLDTANSGIKVYLYNVGEKENPIKPKKIENVTEAVKNSTNGSKDLTSVFTVTYKALEETDAGKKLLTVSCEDLKGAAGNALRWNSQIIVVYAAMMNEDAVVGTAGNPNEVKVEYSNDPYTASTGTTTPEEPKVYTVGLNVNKVDGSKNDAPLAGAAFKLKRWNWTTIEDVTELEEKWDDIGKDIAQSQAKVEWAVVKTVAAGGPDGSPKYVVEKWVDQENEATELKTDENGKMEIVGLRGFGIKHTDEEPHTYKANYALVETTTPTGYETVNEIIFTIEIKVSQSGQLTKADLYRHSSNQIRTDVVMINPDNHSLLDADNVAGLKIRNYPAPFLPHTGGIGANIVYAVSGGAVLVGIFLLFAAVKKRRYGKHERS